MGRFDALVIGGGPAGSAAAIRLAVLGRRVALAEGEPDRFKIGESLPPAVKPLLSKLSALSACDDALASFGNQSAWGSPRLEDTDFIRDPNGCGWHVDRQRFEARLRARAVESGAAVFEPVRISGVVREAGEWVAGIPGTEALRARWIVDCTGRNAAFAQQQGVRRVHCDGLVAIAAVFSAPVEDRDSRTLVESVEAGWWYTSLIPGNRRVAVFHTDPGTPEYHGARTPEGFLGLLQATRYSQERIGEAHSVVEQPRVLPANSSRLEDAIGDGWLAAGDSAIAFDPLSSQGILTALYTGIHAAEAVDRMLAGESGAGEQYREIMNNVFAAYLENRDRYYAMERRWPAAPFWKSRLR